ncbi:unnamed protein product [Pleuronectes platessa]|uniref:Uncharacterized protein n=1 Tax=Pleuronectes platessa TaxID=8262 RepID=A0A9N7TIS9_PLEPL|nr:unnamed protein product [Pleuronectes platessa]
MQLLSSASSGCCHEPLRRHNALTGGQSPSSLAQQSQLQSEQRGDPHSASSRPQMNRTCAKPPLILPCLTERDLRGPLEVRRRSRVLKAARGAAAAEEAKKCSR